MISKEKAAEAFKEGRSVMLEDGTVVTRYEDMPEEARPDRDMIYDGTPVEIPAFNKDNSRVIKMESPKLVPTDLGSGGENGESEIPETNFKVLKEIPGTDVKVGDTLSSKSFEDEDAINKLVTAGYIGPAD